MYLFGNYKNTWSDIGTEQKAIFFNEPQDKYIFRVKPINGEVSIAEKSIAPMINPTWWAFGSYGLLLVEKVYVTFCCQRQRIVRAEQSTLEIVGGC